MPEALLADLPVSVDAESVCAIFDSCFGASMRTRLVGGGDEPLYLPADTSNDYHQIIFRSDYAASALHEVSHWCIAGERRRQQLDYGYWYEPDGRCLDQQRKFESVEAGPQALEWLFSVAAGRQFRVSIDNLDGNDIDPFPFQLAVWQKVRFYLAYGLPARAAIFQLALQAYSGSQQITDSKHYHIEGIISL
ncbi:MAG: elongation factor P hydroxylase [Gammaproteobacteria bacterium]|nr:elongation factor P hydroxylase [Gammaproteobacteria bacterium]MBU1833441.1 elongation factor P hydroxylase [Gammaproteobacteria bacterium]